jgi:hypothetical protein
MTSSMKKRTALTAAVLTVAGMSACGDGTNDVASLPGQPTTPQQQNLDTAQVLALAQKPSETATPFNVNAGMLELTDTSDTTEPVTVNAQ